jgi:hypothetical protein
MMLHRIVNVPMVSLSTSFSDRSELGISVVIDPYVMKNQPKSVILFPFILRNEIVSILYLENNLVASTRASFRWHHYYDHWK